MSAEQDAFAKAVGALRPYLGELVFVGGWAHRLFRHRPRVILPAFEPLRTDDADVATPLELAPGGRPRIDALLKDAGFSEDLSGDETPPITRYVLKSPAEVFELEFITNLRGSERRRDGRRDVTELIHGITAQKLRHVDVLLFEPWSVRLDVTMGYDVPGGPADVLIPNATSYLFQKLTVLPSRQRNRGGKDVLYLFDTLLLMADALEELSACWRQLEPTIHATTRRKFDSLVRRHFTEDGDCVVAAASIARSTGRPNPPTAATIAATCKRGFAEVFG